MALVQPAPAAPATSPGAAPAAAPRPAVSRLAQMQARFQKKQMEEKEQKLLRLYESQQQRAFQRVGRGSAGSSTASLSSSTSTLASVGGGGGGGNGAGGGKVRQLFEERRTNGWDRSYPLEPVATGGKPTRTSSLQHPLGGAGGYALHAQQHPQQQHLPLAVPKTKLSRGASLDRAPHAAPPQPRPNARRSRSHARADAPPAPLANGPPRPPYEHGPRAYGRRPAPQQQPQHHLRRRRDDDDYEEDDDEDDEDFAENEVNYETLGEEPRVARNGHARPRSPPDSRRQEELFAKYQVRELGNLELLAPSSPPPEIYDDGGVDEGTFIYEKVRTPLRNDELLNNNHNNHNNNHHNNNHHNNNNSDRFKTYVSNKHNRAPYKEEPVPRTHHAMAARAQDAKKAPAARRESLSPPTRAVKAAPPRKTEQKTTPGTKTDVKSPSASGYKSPHASTGSVTSKQGASASSRPASSIVNKDSYTNNMKTSSSQKVRNGPSASMPMRVAPSRDDLTECHICHRRFTNDRIKVHEGICSKTGQKKRKEYDATKHRVQGTEAESFVKRATKQGPSQKKNEVKKADWRKKHEEFIQTIRAAKEAQAHVAAGGKLSDLPPPPPLDTSDYIQCPHCGRRFNEGAAERHIPRCANMQHNKPRPAASVKSLPKRR